MMNPASWVALFAIPISSIGCRFDLPTASPPSDVSPGEAGACGARGESCCVGSCDPRASCDGTACIAADVWVSASDGTFHFDGGSWTHPLLAGTTQRLPGVFALWGTTSNFVVGVGIGGLLLRFDGTTWRRDAPTSSDGTRSLFGVAGSDANDIWAVGDGHFAHFDGTTWLDVPPPPTNGEPFLAVWLSGPGEGWATGVAGNLARLSGGSWAKVSREGNGYDKYGLWGSAANDVWRVGQRHSIATGLPLAIEHFDGVMWRDGAGDLDPEGLLPPLRAVWGSDARHVWAVGERGTIVFWNGMQWTSVLSGTTEDLFAVWGSGPSDVWVAGAVSVRHFNGRAWAPIEGLASPPTAIWLSKE